MNVRLQGAHWARKKGNVAWGIVYYPTDTNLKDWIKFTLSYLTDSQVTGVAVKPNIYL